MKFGWQLQVNRIKMHNMYVLEFFLPLMLLPSKELLSRVHWLDMGFLHPSGSSCLETRSRLCSREFSDMQADSHPCYLQ